MDHSPHRTEPESLDRVSQQQDDRAGHVYARAELHLDLQALNGFTDPGHQDIEGRLDGYISIYSESFLGYLSRLKDYRYADLLGSSFHIEDIRFDPPQLAYVLDVQTWLLWGALRDRFQVILKTEPYQQLHLELSGNWLPNHRILDVLKDKLIALIRKRVDQDLKYIPLEVQIHRTRHQLFFTPQINKIDIPIGERSQIHLERLEGVSGHFVINRQGDLQVRFDGAEFISNSDPHGERGATWTETDRIALSLSVLLYQDQHTQFRAQGTIDIDLNEDETRRIGMQGRTLGEIVERIGLHADIATEVNVRPGSGVQVDSQSKWRFQDVRIHGKTYNIEAADLAVSLDTAQGLSIHIDQPLPPAPFQPLISPNIVEYIIDGPAYFQEICRAIARARESVDLESFLYYDGETTRYLTRLLALKAAGLAQGKRVLHRDVHSPYGVSVHVVFNNTGLRELTVAGLPPEKMFYETSRQLKQEIRELPIQDRHKQQYIVRLERNLRWLAFAEGVARTDHRKLLVIDGSTGYTGGINLGDRFLQEDSFHDLMVKINGPVVREMHQAFIENWLEFSSSRGIESWHLKSVPRLRRHCARYGIRRQRRPVEGALLVTDDRRVEIESAIIHILDRARKTILIEHAYFYHSPTQQALLRALRRGVAVTIVVPERSNIEIFNLTNTANIRELMACQQAEGCGQVHAYLYVGRPGQWAYMAHTKAISVDGEFAVVGSANLTNRSLRSPFRELSDQGWENILFNDEMSLYIADRETVAELNRLIFERDLKYLVRKLAYQDVLDRLAALGGEKALQQAQLQARFA